MSNLKILIINLFPKLYFLTRKKKKIITNQKDIIQFTKKLYLDKTGVELNLDNPTTFYDKVNYLKLFKYNNNLTRYADKEGVKKIFFETEYDKNVNKTIAAFSNVKELKKYLKTVKDKDRIIIKLSHIGGVFFYSKKRIMDKKGNKRSKAYLFEFLKHYLKINYYYYYFEYPYKNIKPLIIIENWLKSKDDKGLQEFQFFCNRGKVKFINVVSNRQYQKNYSELITDENLNLLHVHQMNCVYEEEEIIKPDIFNDMKVFAEKYSQNLDMVRVDLLCDNKNFWFCEFTFYNDAGFNIFYPMESNILIGKMFDIK